MNNSKLRMVTLLLLGLMVIFTIPCSGDFTDPRDVFAIIDFYANMGFPPLPGWRIGGDPCLESWQGVECVNTNITAIILNGANLGGQLAESLGNFVSLITLDLSNNHIGGRIPENLPVTVRKFFLSANQFTGTIPSSLSNLSLLTEMAVNDNLLDGELPDAFQSLTGLVNLDLSSNKLIGQLPPSMGNMSSMITLHMQNNHLSGILNVLQDLPLQNLNIENNLFSGPIPAKLLTLPNFKKDGNPFNTTIPPSPAPASPPFHPPGAPVPSSNSPDRANSSLPEKIERKSTTRVIIYAAISVASLILAVLMIGICITKLRKKQKNEGLLEVKEERGNVSLKGPISSSHNTTLIIPNTDINKGDRIDKSEKQKHGIDMRETDVIMMPALAEKITTEPIFPLKSQYTASQNANTSVPSFSVASLQQYTKSFSEENLISNDTVGKVYLAALLDGKFLTVLKLDEVNLRIPPDEFHELVLRVSRLRHPNIVELAGYCAEYEQRLLVYNYFSKMTLHEVLHCEDDLKGKLAWNARVEVALGAARALEYLHESCQPSVIHQNFDSAKILLDDGLAVRVSECGLASLMLSNVVGQASALPNHEAPEVNDFGLYTDKSDVYSFGVVMLELLTGRKPYDSSRPREQRYLVRWASSRLYDINALSKMVDPSLSGKLPMKSLSWFADVINRCIQQQPEFRPLMSEVVQDLAHMIEDARKNADITYPHLL